MSCILPKWFGNTVAFTHSQSERFTGMLRSNIIATPSQPSLTLDHFFLRWSALYLPQWVFRNLRVVFICAGPTPIAPSGSDTFTVDYPPRRIASILIIHIWRLGRRSGVLRFASRSHLRHLMGANYRANARISRPAPFKKNRFLTWRYVTQCRSTSISTHL